MGDFKLEVSSDIAPSSTDKPWGIWIYQDFDNLLIKNNRNLI